MQRNSDRHLHKKSLFLLPHFGPSGSFFPESAISLRREEQYVGRGGGRVLTIDQPWSCYQNFPWFTNNFLNSGMALHLHRTSLSARPEGCKLWGGTSQKDSCSARWDVCHPCSWLQAVSSLLQCSLMVSWIRMAAWICYSGTPARLACWWPSFSL